MLPKRLRRYHFAACPMAAVITNILVPILVLGTHSLITMIVLGIGRQKGQYRPPCGDRRLAIPQPVRLQLAGTLENRISGRADMRVDALEIAQHVEDGPSSSLCFPAGLA
jgi:hypothetical protein